MKNKMHQKLRIFTIFLKSRINIVSLFLAQFKLCYKAMIKPNLNAWDNSVKLINDYIK